MQLQKIIGLPSQSALETLILTCVSFQFIFLYSSCTLIYPNIQTPSSSIFDTSVLNEEESDIEETVNKTHHSLLK